MAKDTKHNQPRLSGQQVAAYDAVAEWLKPKGEIEQKVFRLFGYAGTGKTTIARRLADNIDGSVCYAAFTGKAALMMRRSGCTGAQTIHSLIYKVEEAGKGDPKFVLNPDSSASEAQLIVIDECSMVDEELARDLLSFGKPILVLGDPAQLPPVKGTGYFIDADPDFMLTEIHRQAEGNPILSLATHVREGNPISTWKAPDAGVQFFDRGVLKPNDLEGFDQILCGKNMTRGVFNARLRANRGITSCYPVKGDKLVCLRNDKSKGIFNGGLHIVETKPHFYAPEFRFEVSSTDFPDHDPKKVQVRKEFFDGTLEDVKWWQRKGCQEFDYGYVLTCHKAQGSQWDSVLIYDESNVFRDDAARWLYTAITRASRTLSIAR